MKAEVGTVKVVTDPASAEYLEGASLDYKDGLRGRWFQHQQPERHPHVRVRAKLFLSPLCGAASRPWSKPRLLGSENFVTARSAGLHEFLNGRSHRRGA